jgi:hypothetical protein
MSTPDLEHRRVNTKLARLRKEFFSVSALAIAAYFFLWFALGPNQRAFATGVLIAYHLYMINSGWRVYQARKL